MYPEYLNVFDSGDRATIARRFTRSLGAYLAGAALRARPRPDAADPDSVQRHRRDRRDRRLRRTPTTCARSVTSRKVSPTLNIGGPPQFEQSTPGLPTIEQVYRLHAGRLQARWRSAISTRRSTPDTVQAADVGTTDGQLASGDYKRARRPRAPVRLGQRRPGRPDQRAARPRDRPSRRTINRIDALLTTRGDARAQPAVDIGRPGPGGGRPAVPGDPRADRPARRAP